MNRQLMNIAAVALALFCTGTALAQEPASLNTTFWNIRWFPGGNPNPKPHHEERQVEAVHKVLAELTPDILGMEELRNWESAERAIAGLTGFKVDVCSSFIEADKPGSHQIAIASRLPAIGAWAEPWKVVDPPSPPRGFAFAAYQPAPGKVLLVYAVHFKSNRGDVTKNISMREESMRQLLDHHEAMVKAYGSMGDVMTVMGGDFNTSQEDPRFAEENSLRLALEKGFKWSWEGMGLEQRVTLPASKNFPAQTFDHVLYKNAGLERAFVTKVPWQASDHYPVTAVFKLTAE